MSRNINTVMEAILYLAFESISVLSLWTMLLRHPTCTANSHGTYCTPLCVLSLLTRLHRHPACTANSHGTYCTPLCVLSLLTRLLRHPACRASTQWCREVSCRGMMRSPTHKAYTSSESVHHFKQNTHTIV